MIRESKKLRRQMQRNHHIKIELCAKLSVLQLFRAERMKDLLLRARVVVRTSNMKISRRRLADFVKTLHQKACRTCSTIIFFNSTNQIIDLWSCRSRYRRQMLNSLLKSTTTFN